MGGASASGSRSLWPPLSASGPGGGERSRKQRSGEREEGESETDSGGGREGEEGTIKNKTRQDKT